MNVISMLIDAAGVPAPDGCTFERRNPLDGSVETRAPAASAVDALAAVDAAAQAFPAWSATGPSHRRELLMKAAHALEMKASAFAEVIAAETGGSGL